MTKCKYTYTIMLRNGTTLTRNANREFKFAVVWEFPVGSEAISRIENLCSTRVAAEKHVEKMRDYLSTKYGGQVYFIEITPTVNEVSK